MKKLYLLISFIAVALGAAAQCSVTATSLSDVVCHGQCNGIAYAATGGGGTPPYTYNWSPAGGTGATGTGLCAGIYTVTLTDAVGCTSTDTVLIVQPPTLFANAIAMTPSTCTNGSDGCLRSAPNGGNGGPFNYLWSPAGGSGQTACGLEGGNEYTVTVTDHKGCTAVDSAHVSQPAYPLHDTLVVQNNPSCNGGCNGSVVIPLRGGTSPYYVNSVQVTSPYTSSNLCAGPWQVTFTDANGCTFQAVGSLGEPTALSVSAGTSSTIGCAGGNGCATATVNGGTSPYTYSWSPNGGAGATACGLAAGLYTVHITDAHGCTGMDTVSITQPSTFNGQSHPALQNELCYGDNIGSAYVTASGGTGPYTYHWNTTPAQNYTTAAFTSTATSLPAGSYNCTITDANGCTATAGAVITQPNQINPHLTLVNNVSCNGGFDGCLSDSTTGGTPGYTYDWSTTFPECGLPAGTYTLTVTDNNGCSTTATATVSQPTALTAFITTTYTSCGSCTNGTATVHPSGGTGPYTYFWNTSPTQTTQTATNLGTGSYTCCVTDAHGCQTCSFSSVLLSVGTLDKDGISFSVYPNPFHSSATLILNSALSETAELHIYDMVGNEVEKSEIRDTKTEISNLSQGVYLLIVRDAVSGKMAHTRLIVQ